MFKINRLRYYLTVLCLAFLSDQAIAGLEITEPTELGPCFNDGGLLPLNTSSFGNLRSVFDCDVMQRKNFRERRSDIVDPVNGKQTAYWAQEMVGADLANEYMERLKARDNNAIGISDVPVGIVDSGFALTTLKRERIVGGALACRTAVRQCNPDAADLILRGHTSDEVSLLMENMPFQSCPNMNKPCPSNITQDAAHGTQVGNLIIGDPPMSSTNEARLSWIEKFKEGSGGAGDILSSFQAANPKPKIVNLSMQCPLEIRSMCEGWTPSYKTMSEQTVVVKASGNHFPEEVDPTTKAIDGIVVGSLSPSGLASGFSQEGPEVTISAPSDVSLLSQGAANKDDERAGGRESRFSGTSGAAPMVTSALTNVMALLPGVSTAELKILLAKTALTTAGTSNPGNGAGSLNALKLVEVAHRLKAANWPRAEARAMLQTRELYDFKEQAKRLMDKAKKLMAELPYNENICNRHKEAFKLLRQAFFLSPGNPHIRKALGDIYRANGYEAQANFADPSKGKRGIALGLKSKAGRLKALIRSGTFEVSDAELMLDVLQSEELPTSVLRSMYALLPQAKNVVAGVISTLGNEDAKRALEELASYNNLQMSKEKGAEFIKMFLKSPKFTEKSLLIIT